MSKQTSSRQSGLLLALLITLAALIVTVVAAVVLDTYFPFPAHGCMWVRAFQSCW